MAKSFTKSKATVWGGLGFLTFLLCGIAAYQAYGPRFDCILKITEPMATDRAIESAVNNFFIEYHEMPAVGSHVTTDSKPGVQLLKILLGVEDSSEKVQNTRHIRFLDVREGRNRKDGLIYDDDSLKPTGLFDPWGHPYTVELSPDGSKHLHFMIGSETVDLHRLAAAYSPGPDGKPGTSDDVKSW